MLGTAPGDSLRHSRSSRAGAGGQGPASDPLGGTQALMGGDAEFGASCDLIGGGDGPGGVLRDSDLEYLERLGAGGTALLYGGKVRLGRRIPAAWLCGVEVRHNTAG